MAAGLSQLAGIAPADAANQQVGSLQTPTGTFTNLFTSKQPYNSAHYGVVMGDLITQTITGVGTTDPSNGATWTSESPNIPIHLNCGSGCTGSNTSAPGVVSAPSGQYPVTGTYTSANGGTITFSYTVPATGQFCTTYPIQFGSNYQDKSSTSPDGDATWTNTGVPYATSTSTNGCPVDVANARTATTSNIDGTVVNTGTAVYPVVTSIDDANAQPSQAPTGTVTYTLYDNGTCTPGSGTPPANQVSTQTVTISGGVVPNGTSNSSLTAGTYSYLTSYSGDSNYGSATLGCEVFTIAIPAQTVTTHVLNASGTDVTGTNVALGTTTHDTTSLSSSTPTPTGTVTYSFYSNGSCTGTATSTQTVTLSGGTVPASNTQTLGSGSYSYKAAYSGNSSYAAATGSCEQFGVSTATPTITNQIQNGSNTNVTGSSVALGTAIHDSSSLGSTVSGFTPSGTVTYSYFSNGTCSGTATSTQTVTLSSGSIPNSSAQTPSAGSYSYEITYNGDSNYAAVTSGCSAVTVNTSSLSISTQVQNGSGSNITGSSASLGTATHDTVTLNGTSGFTPTGSVTYKFFTNGTCNGTATSSETDPLSAGTAPSSASQTLAAGSYSYLTSYSGDSNYASASAGCESFTIAPATPTISTQVKNGSGTNVTGGNVALGTSTNDTTTLGSAVSGFTPTGTVTYQFFSNGTCNGAATSSQTVTLSGGTIPPSASQTLSGGSYSYLTTYSGDSNYTSVAASCETFSVAQASLTLSTQVQNGSGSNVTGSSVSLGTATHDTAAFSGTTSGFTPSGTVTYKFFANGTCTGTASSSQTVTVSSGSVPNSAAQTLAAGSYSYLTSYAGDSNYGAAVAGCESFTVGTAAPSLTTQVQDGSGNNVTSGSVSLGAATHDTASVGGTASGFAPTGTVTYQFFTNGTCNGTASSSQTVTLSSGSVPNSSAQSLAAGRYSYLASYSGDSNYSAATAGCEPFAVGAITPTLATQVQDGSGHNVTSGSVSLGTATNDTSSIGGTAAGFTPTGSVTYNFFSNGTCSGTPSSSQTVTVSAGSVPNASAQTLAAGSYSYLASYSGDSNYNGTTAGCESFTVNQGTPSLSTQVQDGSGKNVNGSGAALGTVTQDTSSLGSTVGSFTPTGQVSYQFFSDGTCTGSAISTQTVTVSAGSVPNASAQTLAAGSYSYLASYSGDSNYNGTTAGCESFTVNQATPSLSTQVQDGSGNNVNSSGAALGTATQDTSSLGSTVGSFTPTGTVTYEFFSNGACSGTPTSSQVVALAGGAVPSSTSQTLLAGAYSYLASYSGDSNYASTAAGCETFTVNQASPSLTTAVLDANGNNVTGTTVQPGTTTNDTAALGSTVSGVTPTGTVTYEFFSNGACSGTPASSQTVTIASGAIPASSAQTLAAGSYSYLTSYSGDSNYNPVSASCEAFARGTANTSVTTQVEDGNGNPVANGATVDPGTSTQDTASVSAPVNGIAITGTVTYEFFSNGACSGSPASSQTVTISGGQVPDSTLQTLPYGSYSYLASYSGDSNYNPSTASCETFNRGDYSVSLTGQVLDSDGQNITGPSVYVPLLTVHDTSTIGSSQPSTPITGTVTYTLYVGGTCSGTVVTTETVTITNGQIPNSSAIIPTLTYGSVTSQQFSYLASYSGDGNYAAANSPCQLFTRWCSDAYWRTFYTAGAKLILGAQPFTVGNDKISGVQSGIITKMKAIFAAASCSTITSTTAAGCLANWLLTEEVDVLNGSPTNIDPTIATAQQFLGQGGTAQTVTYDGVTTQGIVYTSPSTTYTLTPNQVTVAENLALSLLNYTRTGSPS